MIRFLSAPIAMSATIGVLAFALYWSVTSHAETRVERDGLGDRIETINEAREIDRDVEALDDTSFGNELTERLSGGAE